MFVEGGAPSDVLKSMGNDLSLCDTKMGQLMWSAPSEGRDRPVMVSAFFPDLLALDFDGMDDQERIIELIHKRVAYYPSESWSLRRTTHGFHAVLISDEWPDLDKISSFWEMRMADIQYMEATKLLRGARLRITPKSLDDHTVSYEISRETGASSKWNFDKLRQLELLDAMISYCTRMVSPRYLHLMLTRGDEFFTLEDLLKIELRIQFTGEEPKEYCRHVLLRAWEDSHLKFLDEQEKNFVFSPAAVRALRELDWFQHIFSQDRLLERCHCRHSVGGSDQQDYPAVQELEKIQVLWRMRKPEEKKEKARNP